MEGYNGQLKEEANQDHGNPGNPQWEEQMRITAHLKELNTASSAINQTNTIKHSSCGYRANNQILYCRLAGILGAHSGTCQNVEGNGHQLQTNKHGKEIRSRSQHTHTQQCH